MKSFNSINDAKIYADKNRFSGTYIIEETRNGFFRIKDKDINGIEEKNICVMSRRDFHET